MSACNFRIASFIPRAGVAVSGMGVLVVIASMLVPVRHAHADGITGTLLYRLQLEDAYVGEELDIGGTAGPQFVGFGAGTATGGAVHALVWSGPDGIPVDLNPTNLSGITSSSAIGTNGAQQVGFGNGHALLWSGTADSAVDLNPTNLSGITSSTANGTSGTQQVGFGSGTATGGNQHAMLWSGTADSAVDLNPNGFTMSMANGAGGTQQVGYGKMAGGTATINQYHALLWNGTADSAVDLNPSGFTSSFAEGTNGTQQVGFGNGHALLWSGTADSAVDLNAFLPATISWSSSEADSIDAAGNIYGQAIDTTSNFFAVEWSPMPEPSVASIVEAAVGSALLIRRRKQ